VKASRSGLRAGIETGIVAAASLWLAATIVVGAHGAPFGARPEVFSQTVPPPAPATGTRSVLDGVFTDAQAKRGGDVYSANCAHCHGDTLQGGDDAPPLGAGFIASWKTVGDLVEKIRRSMPEDAPASLTAQQYTDVVTFLLGASHYPSGPTELPVDAAQQKLIKVEPVK
jgi:mono/diheme cytochrome c family protein